MQQSFISDRSLYNGQKNTVIHLVEKMADVQIDENCTTSLIRIQAA
jgi:hypothetical protein